MSRAACLACMFVALAACQPRSELIVGFATDLTATGEIDQLTLSAMNADTGFPVGDDQTFPIVGSAGEHFNLPASYGYYSTYGDETLSLTLTASLQGQPIISQRVVLGIVAGQTLFYRMGITADCDPSAMTSTCGSNETCIEGTCHDVELDTLHLPHYEPDLVTMLTCPTPEHYIFTATGSAMMSTMDAASCPTVCIQGLCMAPPTGSGSSGSGDFATQDYLKASDTIAGAGLGYAVALSDDGNTLAVGAPFDPDPGSGIDPAPGAAGATTGTVYMFTYAGSSWTQQAVIKADHPAMGGEFGFAVALSADGNTLAIGSPAEPSAATGIDGDDTDTSKPSGAVFVYTRAGATWQRSAYVKPAVNNGGELFGTAVALAGDGNTLAVGAIDDASASTGVNSDATDTSALEAGAAYVFRHTTAWAQEAYVKPDVIHASDQLGISVALATDGDTLAVGAQDESSAATTIDGDATDTSAMDAGAAYVFGFDGGAWTQRAYLKAANAQAGDLFGAAVAISGDSARVAVGAYGESSSASGVGGDSSDNLAPQAGAAYVFSVADGVWSQEAYIKASDPEAQADFGGALAFSRGGTVLAVGALQENGSAPGVDGSQTTLNSLHAGASYVYRRSAASWAQIDYVKAPTISIGGNFGAALAVSADGTKLAVGERGDASDATGIDGDAENTAAAGAGAVCTYR